MSLHFVQSSFAMKDTSDSGLPATSDREILVCCSIEELLHVATGRCRVGHINEILLRLVRRATCLSPPYESDIPILANAIWSVLVSQDPLSKLRIGGTTTGISGETTRLEFVRQYANRFVYETPSPEYCSYRPKENVSECFEETLVGLATLWRIDMEGFNLFEILPILISFSRSLDARFDDVCESFLRMISTIESAFKELTRSMRGSPRFYELF